MLQDIEPPIHVMPQFGKEHECTRDCWCEPVCENTLEVIHGEAAALIYIHNVAH